MPRPAQNWLDPDWPHLNSIPRTLYRYMTFERGRDVLSSNQLYFSSPQGFNDPFDCRVTPSFKDPVKDLEKYARSLARRQFPTLPRHERRQKLRSIRPQLRGSRFEEIYKEWEWKVLDQSGILCLTEKRDDILMWSHYANGHTGVCLEFEYTPGGAFSGFSLPVSYAEEFPNITFAEIFNARDERAAMVQFGKLLFLIKSWHWRYEKEWRLIRIATEQVRLYGLCSFPARLLRGVIVGCRMSDEHKHEIYQLSISRLPRPILYEAVKKDRQFALEIRLVSLARS